MEYWHELITEKSWKILQQLKGKFKFILIGGWAAYLYARTQKSRDIDIIVDIQTLQQIKNKYELRKNDNLKKYEIKIEEIDVDIYVPFYSKLAVPAERIESQKIEGFDVAKPEELLILKQGAELDRKHSEKGEKDRIDIMSILLNCQINFDRYKKILKNSNQEHLIINLIEILKSFNEYNHFSMLPSEFKRRKLKIIGELKRR